MGVGLGRSVWSWGSSLCGCLTPGFPCDLLVLPPPTPNYSMEWLGEVVESVFELRASGLRIIILLIRTVTGINSMPLHARQCINSLTPHNSAARLVLSLFSLFTGEN